MYHPTLYAVRRKSRNTKEDKDGSSISVVCQQNATVGLKELSPHYACLKAKFYVTLKSLCSSPIFEGLVVLSSGLQLVLNV